MSKSEPRPRNMKVHSTEDMEALLRGVKVAACMLTEPQQIVVDEESVLKRVSALTLSSRSACSCCGVPFDSRAQQIAHYKHHWHAHNLKRRLFGKPPLTLANFTNRQEDNSSVSGSDSDEDAGTENAGAGVASDLFAAATRHCKAFFTNDAGQVFCLYRCILHHRKETLSTDGEGHAWTERVRGAGGAGGRAARWAVLMVSGGHFAGAVFSGGAVMLHKTFHSYVARRGQGQAQGTRDQQGNAPRSAGASLRRYNQAQFAIHVEEILRGWSEELRACELLLYRAVGPLNQAVLFGKLSPLAKDDLRLRALPFPTRKPTFKEVQRAHATVSNVEVYDSLEQFQRALIASSLPTEGERSRKPKTPTRIIDRAKSREPVARELPAQLASSDDDGPCYIDSETPVDWIKTLSEQSRKNQISNSKKDLFHDECEQDGDSSPSEMEDRGAPRQQKKKKKKKPKADKKPVVKVSESVKKLWEVIMAGSTEQLEALTAGWGGAGAGEELATALNTPDPRDGNTALHKAALAASPRMVTCLLRCGGDPCTRNQTQQTAYVTAADAETRTAFRLFRGEWPDRFNYAKAHIPGALTPAQLVEEAERKAAQRRARRLRDKDKQQERQQTNKFLQLTDADKLQMAESSPRCFLCGARLPRPSFEYESYRFCSVRCLQSHRKVRPLHLPA